MLEVRPYAQLGRFANDWLQARYHFSFANYHDPQRMGWGSIRVWNDDIIAPHAGFPLHPHDNMEIITFVRKGEILHRDDQGHVGTTQAGDVQVMTAGRGIRHMEWNAGDTPTRLFQIWLLPEHRDTQPRWQTRPFPRTDRINQFVTLASGHPEDTDALPIGQKARVLGATLTAGTTTPLVMRPDHYGYAVISKGKVDLGDHTLTTGDAVAVHDHPRLSFTALDDTEVIVVEAPPLSG